MERGERILDYEVPDTKEFCEDQCIVMAMMASGQCKADFIPLEFRAIWLGKSALQSVTHGIKSHKLCDIDRPLNQKHKLYIL